MRRDSFVVGAFVLMLGSFVSRILGATYRIIVPILMGGGHMAAVGMGLFGMAAPVYGVLLSASATGLPVAVARMVSARVSVGRSGEARAVLRTALTFVTLVGLVASLALFFGAPWYARQIARDARAEYAVAAVAPAILVVSLGAVFRGFLQGLRQMTPYAVSQVIEQSARVVAIIALVVALMPRGVEWAAAGASFGAAVGGGASLLYLLTQIGSVRRVLASEGEAAPPGAVGVAVGVKGGHARELIGLALPISLSYMVLPLVNFIDALLVPSRLHAAGLGGQATALYGLLNGFATPFMVMPTTFTAALALNLVPAVSEAQARHDDEAVRRRVELAVRLSLIVALPAAAGLAVLATPIESVFFRAPEAGSILLVLATGIVAIGLQQVTAAALQGLGKPVVPMMTLFAGGAAKFVLTYLLVADPAIHVRGAAAATVVAFLLAAFLNAAVLARQGYGVAWGKVLAAPLAAALGMAVLTGVVFKGAVPAAEAVFGTRGGEGAALALAILAGLASYAVLAARTGAVRANDVLALPRVGKSVLRTGRRLGFWKEGEA